MRQIYRKRNYNRLLERGTNTKAMTFKMDERSRLVAETLLKAGYANVGEMFIDLLYREANRMNPSLCLPVVSGLKDKKDELAIQINQLQNLVREQMGVL